MSNHKITLEFESEDARDKWMSTYLDGGGEDAFIEYCDFYTKSWTASEILIGGSGGVLHD